MSVTLWLWVTGIAIETGYFLDRSYSRIADRGLLIREKTSRQG